MQHETSGAAPVLDYATPREGVSPRRYWLPALFLAIVFVGENYGVVRIYRWPWPATEDYLLLGILLAGAVITARFSKIPGWLIGLYGLAGIYLFFEGQFVYRQVWMEMAEPGVLRMYAAGWITAIIAIWAACRASVLLRHLPPPPPLLASALTGSGIAVAIGWTLYFALQSDAPFMDWCVRVSGPQDAFGILKSVSVYTLWWAALGIVLGGTRQLIRPWLAKTYSPA